MKIKMKRFAIFSVIVTLLLSCSGKDAPETVILREGWTMTQESTGKKYNVEVPTTVAGAIAGPEGTEQPDAGLVEGGWTFSKKFNAKKGSYYTLRFEGISYRADIFLNGTKIASRDTTEGVFAVREFDVTSLIKGSNTLDVSLERAKPGELDNGFVDWNPAPVDGSMGIVRGVTLEKTGPVYIKDVYVRPVLSDDLKVADLEISYTVKNLSGNPVQAEIMGKIGKDGEFKKRYELGPLETRVIRDGFRIRSPRLWWIRELGTPEMYTLSISAKVDGSISSRRDQPFGIRRLVSVIDGNGHRKYILNGKPLLLLGGGWTDDIFLRETEESIEHQIELVKDMGLNCIRFENIWGRDSKIYDLCDRNGILVIAGWSCQWEWDSYCGIPHDDKYGCIVSPEAMDLAVRYFRDQLIFLRNHPSLAAWLSGSDRIPLPELEARYLEVLAEISPDTPYVPSASSLNTPAALSGNKMRGPYEYVGPEYWYEDKRLGGAFGFNTETSIGLNMPQLESVKRMIPEDELWPLGPGWDRHCTSAAEAMHSTGEIVKAVLRQFGPSENVEQFVERAEALDYEGTRAMFEAFRINRPVATGLIQWMLNSAWPSLYWQLYDWYGIPTAGYYGVKKSLQPLQILYNWSDSNLYLVSSAPKGRTVDATVWVHDASGALLDRYALRFDEPSGEEATPLLPLIYPGKDIFVFTELETPDGIRADNAYAIPSKGNIHDWAHSTWYQTPVLEWADKSFLAGLPEGDLSIAETGKGTATVTNCGSTPAFQIVLKLKDKDGNLVRDAFWSDNFFTLAPGQSKTVTFRGEGKIGFTSGI